jgi:exopolysaccharide biosynthesis polyprenyl glycosylphosphotransferase
VVILVDVVLVIFSDLTAFTLRYGTDIAHPPAKNFLAYLQISKFIIILRLLCFYIFGFYHKLKSKTIFNIIVTTMRATTASSVIIIMIAFYFRALAYPRTVIFISWALTTATIILWRILIQTIATMVWREPATNAIIIGTDKQAHRFGLHLSEDAATKYRLLGFVQSSLPSSESGFVDQKMILGNLNDLEKVIVQYSVDEIMVTAESLTRRQIFQIFNSVEGKNIVLKLLPDIYEAVIGNIIISSGNLGDSLSGILVSPLEVTDNWYIGLKRILDLIFSLSMLIIFSPIMVVIAILIKITSSGPVVFQQERVGLNGRRFMMYKFRTMHKEAEEDLGPVWAAENDTRITPLGRFLRFSRLDELPQLVNVIKNDMSLVGPRPERPYFVDKLIHEIPFYTERLTVKPGITGWAQVTGKYADSLEDNKEKLLSDIFYIKNMSLSLDVWIFFKTIWTIIQEKGAQ